MLRYLKAISYFFLYLLMMGTSSLTVAASTYYKWVDKNGITHYTQTPPTEKGFTATKIKAKSQRPTNPEEAQKRLNQNRESFHKAATDREKYADMTAEQKRQAKLKETIKKDCNQAKLNLDTLSQNSRVREQDAEGNFKYLSEDEHANRIKQAQEYISNYCNKP